MSSSIEGPQKPLPRAPEAQERTPPSWVRIRWERGSQGQPDLDNGELAVAEDSFPRAVGSPGALGLRQNTSEPWGFRSGGQGEAEDTCPSPCQVCQTPWRSRGA